VLKFLSNAMDSKTIRFAAVSTFWSVVVYVVLNHSPFSMRCVIEESHRVTICIFIVFDHIQFIPYILPFDFVLFSILLSLPFALPFALRLIR